MPETPARDVEQLAAQLGRPAAAFSGLRGLTPAQIGLLSEAVAATRSRRRHLLENALAQRLPRPAARAVASALRARRR